MTEQRETRRVRMTKRLMKDALIELLEKQPLANISVTTICDTADVHRSTFYKYYTDTIDLLEDIVRDSLAQLPTPPEVLNQQTEEQLLLETTAFFDFIKENEKTYRILFSDSASSSFTAQMVTFLCNGYVPVIKGTNEMDDQFTRLYIAHAIVGMMREWVNAGFPLSSRKMAELLYSLSRNVIS